MKIKQMLVAGLALVLVACSGTAKKEESVTTGTSASAATSSAPAIVSGSIRDFQLNVGDRVLFAYNESLINVQSRRILTKQAAFLKSNSNVTVIVEGHCDERGTREYNLALGERRATAVRDFLVSLGVAPSRIKTISYGKERPSATGSNPNAWRLNRRAVTRITGGTS